jgi:CTP synthase (UTP-ammonia lyase)
VDAQLHPDREVQIAFVGKYLDLLDAYKSLVEAIIHAGIHTRTRVVVKYLDAEDIERHGTAALDDVAAILVPGGFGRRGFEGKIRAVQYARERRVPYLGICYGLHAAVIEFARHVAGFDGRPLHRDRPRHAASGDRPDHRVAGRAEGQRRAAQRPATTWAAPCAWASRSAVWSPGPWPRASYGTAEIRERHRHRFEVNNRYVAAGGARPGGVRAIGGRRAGGDDRAAPTTPGFWPASSTRSSPRRPATGTRCSPASSRAALAQAEQQRGSEVKAHVRREVQEKSCNSLIFKSELIDRCF